MAELPKDDLFGMLGLFFFIAGEALFLYWRVLDWMGIEALR
jgi:hypothetical protein